MNKPDMTRADALDVLEEVRGCAMPIVLACELDAAIGILSSPCACGGREPLHVVRTIAWRRDGGRLYVVADTEHVYFGEAGSKSTSDELVNVTAIVLEGWHPPLTSDELAYVDAAILGIFHTPNALPADEEGAKEPDGA